MILKRVVLSCIDAFKRSPHRPDRSNQDRVIDIYGVGWIELQQRRSTGHEELHYIGVSGIFRTQRSYSCILRMGS